MGRLGGLHLELLESINSVSMVPVQHKLFPDCGALAAPPRGKTLRVLVIFHTSVQELAVLAACAGPLQGCRGLGCSPRGWALAPPGTCHLALLWLRRDATGFLPTPTAQWVLVAQ